MPARHRTERLMIARIAAADRWAQEPDRAAATAPARAGLRAKFEREVDPDGTLPADVLAERVAHLQHAHMLRMSRAAAAKRRQRGLPPPAQPAGTDPAPQSRPT
jgi:hypothetical protein